MRCANDGCTTIEVVKARRRVHDQVPLAPSAPLDPVPASSVLPWSFTRTQAMVIPTPRPSPLAAQAKTRRDEQRHRGG